MRNILLNVKYLGVFSMQF